jgi:hypothetical protein
MTATCQAIVHRSVNRGVLAKGTDSHTTVAHLCGRTTTEGSTLCPRHQTEAATNRAKLARLRKERAQ